MHFYICQSKTERSKTDISTLKKLCITAKLHASVVGFVTETFGLFAQALIVGGSGEGGAPVVHLPRPNFF